MQEHGDGRFPTTQWTLIDRIRSTDVNAASRALELVCAQYHYPLYCYIRRRSLGHHDAQDALHDFLAKLLQNATFQQAFAEQGRLRGFLCTALQRFLINRQLHSDTQQQRRHISLETVAFALGEDEQRYLKERWTDTDTPERAFERQWARELMSGVLHQLATHYQNMGKADLFQALRPVLLSGGTLTGESVPALAASLGMTEGGLRTAKSRLLVKYRHLLEQQVAHTVPSDDDVRGEIDYLLGLFAPQ